MTRRERRKARKISKIKKRLYYKVLHQENKPNKLVYAIELFFAMILEVLRKAFKIIIVSLLFTLFMGIFSAFTPVFTNRQFLPVVLLTTLIGVLAIVIGILI